MLPKKEGVMIILSSPSGAGKTTLVKMLSKLDNFEISISHTTRKPRHNEKYDEDNSIWQDHTYNTRPPLMIDFDTLYCNIQAVLEKWEKFGYLYFIKDGKCPKK